MIDQLYIYLGIKQSHVIPWGEIIGLFLFFAGFVIGLGAVTVIDIHGLLGRNSSYWTEATIRTHKVTKPLIWLGIGLALLGGLLFYRNAGFPAIAVIHLILAFILIINGIFLSFWVSPRLLRREKEGRAKEILPMSLQEKIAVSFVVSIVGWWGSLILLVWYLIVLR